MMTLYSESYLIMLLKGFVIDNVIPPKSINMPPDK